MFFRVMVNRTIFLLVVSVLIFFLFKPLCIVLSLQDYFVEEDDDEDEEKEKVCKE